MYIMVEDPETGKRLYADISIHEKMLGKGAFPPTEIVDIKVMDTCTADELARDVVRGLPAHIYDGITKIELCRILKDKFRILHFPDEFLEAIHALMGKAVPVIE